jgi:hypothetical protein
MTESYSTAGHTQNSNPWPLIPSVPSSQCLWAVGSRGPSRWLCSRRAQPTPEDGSTCKSSSSIALICTTSRRIPASPGTNQGPNQSELISLWGVSRAGCSRRAQLTPGGGGSCRVASQGASAVERTWHKADCQGHILALARR